MERDYREKEVDGFLMEVSEMKLLPAKVTVRMTSDYFGKSISFSAFNVMIEIPLEAVDDIIQLKEK